jgi:excisionase family DNA binding protein
MPNQRSKYKSKLSIWIPSFLKERADKHCKEQGIFITEYIAALIQNDLILNQDTLRQPAKKNLMTVAEASNYLDVHPNTIRNYVKAKMIPVHKLSNRIYRFKKEDLDRFLSAKLKS